MAYNFEQRKEQFERALTVPYQDYLLINSKRLAPLWKQITAGQDDEVKKYSFYKNNPNLAIALTQLKQEQSWWRLPTRLTRDILINTKVAGNASNDSKQELNDSKQKLNDHDRKLILAKIKSVQPSPGPRILDPIQLVRWAFSPKESDEYKALAHRAPNKKPRKFIPQKHQFLRQLEQYRLKTKHKILSCNFGAMIKAMITTITGLALPYEILQHFNFMSAQKIQVALLDNRKTQYRFWTLLRYGLILPLLFLTNILKNLLTWLLLIPPLVCGELCISAAKCVVRAKLYFSANSKAPGQKESTAQSQEKELRAYTRRFQYTLYSLLIGLLFPLYAIMRPIVTFIKYLLTHRHTFVLSLAFVLLTHLLLSHLLLLSLPLTIGAYLSTCLAAGAAVMLTDHLWQPKPCLPEGTNTQESTKSKLASKNVLMVNQTKTSGIYTLLLIGTVTALCVLHAPILTTVHLTWQLLPLIAAATFLLVLVIANLSSWGCRETKPAPLDTMAILETMHTACQSDNKGYSYQFVKSKIHTTAEDILRQRLGQTSSSSSVTSEAGREPITADTLATQGKRTEQPVVATNTTAALKSGNGQNLNTGKSSSKAEVASLTA